MVESLRGYQKVKNWRFCNSPVLRIVKTQKINVLVYPKQPKFGTPSGSWPALGCQPAFGSWLPITKNTDVSIGFLYFYHKKTKIWAKRGRLATLLWASHLFTRKKEKKNLGKNGKKIFWLAFGCASTQDLVLIHNTKCQWQWAFRSIFFVSTLYVTFFY